MPLQLLLTINGQGWSLEDTILALRLKVVKIKSASHDDNCCSSDNFALARIEERRIQVVMRNAPHLLNPVAPFFLRMSEARSTAVAVLWISGWLGTDISRWMTCI
jgi:hypothetical protein